MSLKATSSIADRNIEKSVGTSTLPILDTVFYSKCIRDLPSIPAVDHYYGMQTIYYGCELFGASIFPRQLTPSSPPNDVEYIRLQRPYTEVDLALYALILEL